MLEGRTVAVVGASERPDSFGWRMTTEVLRSSGDRARPAWSTRRARRCSASPACRRWPTYPSRSTWCCSASPDHALVDQVRIASARGDGGAVVFGAAHGLRDDAGRRRRRAGVCGGGCMGFVNAVRGVRAIGYLERDPLPAGPDRAGHPLRLGVLGDAAHPPRAWSTPSPSRRARSWSPPPPTTSPTRCPCRRPASSGWCSRRCATPTRCAAVPRRRRRARHPGRRADRRHLDARAGAGRRALRSHRRLGRGVGGAVRGVRRAPRRRPRRAHRQPRAASRSGGGYAARAGGIATVHDSGAERVLVADVAERLGVPFAPLSAADHRAAGRAPRPGPRADEPARRVGHRQRHRGRCSPTA